MSEEVVYVCTRVADGPPMVPSMRDRYCNGCGREVWVDPLSYRRVVQKLGEPAMLKCTACLRKEGWSGRADYLGR